MLHISRPFFGHGIFLYEAFVAAFHRGNTQLPSDESGRKKEGSVRRRRRIERGGGREQPPPVLFPSPLVRPLNLSPESSSSSTISMSFKLAASSSSFFKLCFDHKSSSSFLCLPSPRSR